MLLGFLQGRYQLPIPFFKADDGTDIGGSGESGDTDDIDGDGDESDSDGEEDDETDDDDADETDAEKKLPQSAAESFKRLLARHGGNARKLAAKLFDENWSYRQQNTLLTRENKTLRGRTPKTHRVVPVAEISELKQYRALGKPADVKTRLESARTTETELATRRKDDTLRKVAELTGYSLPVLKDIGGALDYDFDEVEEGDEKYERALVVVKNGDKTEKVPVEDHAEKNWAHFMRALNDDDGTPARTSTRNGSTTQRRIVRQPAASGERTQKPRKDAAVASGYMSTRYGPATKTDS
jgi:hypothetical protein